MSGTIGTYTTAEVLDLLRISENHLRALLGDPDHPLPFRALKLGAAIRFSKAEVDAFLGLDRDADDQRRRQLLERGESLLAALGVALDANAHSQASLAALHAQVAGLLADLTTSVSPPDRPPGDTDTPASIGAGGGGGTRKERSQTNGQKGGRSVPGAASRPGGGRAAGPGRGDPRPAVPAAGRAGRAGETAGAPVAGAGGAAHRGVGGDRAAVRALRRGDHPPPGD